MSLTSLLYVSSAQVPFSNAELIGLLETARRNNAGVGVTGMLVYRDGNFMQVIEGEDDAIQRLHDKIQHDPRHGGLITLLTQRIPERHFPSGAWDFAIWRTRDCEASPGTTSFSTLRSTEGSLQEIRPVPKNCC